MSSTEPTIWVPDKVSTALAAMSPERAAEVMRLATLVVAHDYRYLANIAEGEAERDQDEDLLVHAFRCRARAAELDPQGELIPGGES